MRRGDLQIQTQSVYSVFSYRLWKLLHLVKLISIEL